MNLPNLLTIIRFLLVPVMSYFLVSKNFTVAIIIYILASVTDVLDGFIARKYNMITKLGKFLDPMADKLLQFSALLGLWAWKFLRERCMPSWGRTAPANPRFPRCSAGTPTTKSLPAAPKWTGRISSP